MGWDKTVRGLSESESFEPALSNKSFWDNRNPALCYQYGGRWASQVVLVVKNLPANSGDIRDTGFIPGSGRYFGGGHGNPHQYSRLENSTDRGAWQPTVHRVAKSWTWLKQLSTDACMVATSHTCVSSMWRKCDCQKKKVSLSEI